MKNATPLFAGLALSIGVQAQAPHTAAIHPVSIEQTDSYSTSALLTDGGLLTCALDLGQLILLRTGLQGELQWQKALEFDAWNENYAISSCGEWSNGDLFLFGTYFSGVMTTAYFVARLDPQGDLIWVNSYDLQPGFLGDYGTSRAHALQNGHLLLSIAQFNAMILADVDGAGDMGYIKSFAFDDEKCPGMGCEPTLDGGAIYCGKDSSDQCLIRIDAGGNVAWARAYENNDYTHARSVLPLSDGGYVVCGSHDNDYGGGGDAAFVMRLDANGDVLWHKTYAVTGGMYFFLNRFEKVVALDGGGFAFITDEMYQVLVITDDSGEPIGAQGMDNPDLMGSYMRQELLGAVGSTLRFGGLIYLSDGIIQHYLDRAVSTDLTQGDCLSVPLIVTASDVPAPSNPNAQMITDTPVFVQAPRSLIAGDRDATGFDVCAMFNGIGEQEAPGATLRPDPVAEGGAVELMIPGAVFDRVVAIDATGRATGLSFAPHSGGATISSEGLAAGHYIVRVMEKGVILASLRLMVQ